MNVVSKREAIDLGMERFFTGKPCAHGHVSERSVKHGHCMECASIASRKRREENREQARKYGRDHYWRNIDNRRSYSRNYYHANKVNIIKRLYADCIWIDRVDRLPEKCQVCDSPKNICLDHCHSTNSFRGWLCRSCNIAAGLMRHSPAILGTLAAYLENHNMEVERAGLKKI